ncbi:MAG TPA: thymidine phosphorylase [Candidatus Scybalousia intestinigallinarum]|nr:thymidine phosphorylase [Candidatus Scybalousia intestinigallinarum]
MSMVDTINKKRLGKVLSREELEEAFNGYFQGNIPDYQMSSLLMAICLRGMTDQETLDLTDIFIRSGEVLDLSEVDGITVDKHSTGGVGDKTTLIVASIVASLGLKVPKMSGRGLGHTGGTIDKLESIPGFRVNLSREEFIHQLNTIGVAIISQTAHLAPLDKKVYALRDVTGTVESIPLIASSIMSKKIASGADKIVLDVKVGKGALLKTQEEAIEISRLMKKIGHHYQKDVDTMITYMDIPLGTSIGNALEILEVMRILSNEENNYLVALSKALAAKMVQLGLGISIQDASIRVEDSLKSGKAYKKFMELIEAQGGDISGLRVSSHTQDILSTKSGHVIDMDAYRFGKLSLDLGGGRKTKEDPIDPKVGIVLKKKIGDDVKVGDVLCTLYLREDAPFIQEDLTSYYTFQEEVEPPKSVDDSVEIV